MGQVFFISYKAFSPSPIFIDFYIFLIKSFKTGIQILPNTYKKIKIIFNLQGLVS